MLALRMYFWDDAAWGGAPEPEVPVVEAPPGAGSGGKHLNKHPYTPADDNFWSIRERYLRSLMADTYSAPVFQDGPATIAPLNHPSTFDSSKLSRYLSEQQTLIDAAYSASNLTQLQSIGTRLREINRVVKRAKRIRKLKKIKILALAITALSLFAPNL